MIKKIILGIFPPVPKAENKLQTAIKKTPWSKEIAPKRRIPKKRIAIKKKISAKEAHYIYKLWLTTVKHTNSKK